MLNNDLNVFTYLPEENLKGSQSDLSDLSIAIKDNIMVKSWPVTASSNVLKGHVAEYNATAVERLMKAGVELVGKTNLDEFAMGSSTESSAFGVTKNPWDQTRVPGGSSGGSAVAVAAGLADVSLGSDTGGSIRQPAAFCGVTGLKPTYGAVSRYGLIALSSSLDVIGPLAREATLLERVFQVISGADPLDQTTIDYKYTPDQRSWKGLRVGLPKEHWELEIDPAMKKATNDFVEFARSQGAIVDEVSLPTIKYALPAYYIIMPAEASSNLARYDGIRYQYSAESKTLLERYLQTRESGFGAETKRRILLGTYVLSHGHYDAFYLKAMKVRSAIEQEYSQVFENIDVLISPTTPTLPFKIGELVADPVAMYQSDLLTVSANLAGVPALSLPVGFSQELPIGAQMTAKKGDDALLLNLAKEYQKVTDYHLKKPPVWYGSEKTERSE